MILVHPSSKVKGNIINKIIVDVVKQYIYGKNIRKKQDKSLVFANIEESNKINKV